MNAKTELTTATATAHTATIIESTAVLTKTYKLDESGNVVQHTSANMSQGTATVRSFNTVHELAEILAGLNTNQAMSWGVVKNIHPGQSVTVLSKAKYDDQGRPKTAIARTKDFFNWGENGGVMMLDFDFKDVAMSQDEIIQRLYSIMPELQESAFIWWCSSSSYIYNGDAQHSDLKGQRIYILVKDASDIERAGKVLFERLWLAGYGHIEISGAGSLLVRTIIDSTVWQPNRLDFISGANCIAPMQQKRPEPDIHDGAHLDTAIVLKDLTAAEQAQVAALKEKAKADIRPEANAVKNQYIETAARKNLTEQGIAEPNAEQVEQAKNTVKRAIENNVLAGDFVLYLDDMTAVTVGEILDNPNKYHNSRTKDPLEHDYDGGRTVGRLYLFNGQPNLHSQAHGGQSFKLIRQPKQIEHKNGGTFETVQATLQLLKQLPDFFDLDNQLVTIDNGQVKALHIDLLQYYLGSNIQYFTWKTRGDQQYKALIDPPFAVLKQILSLGSTRGLKPLKAVITAPVITTENHIISKAGYDKETQLYLAVDEQPLDVPKRVTSEDVETALECLLDPFSDFPFVDALDRSVCLSALLTAMIRPVVDTAPAFAIDAPKQGTGKTYLAQCIGYFGTGTVPTPMPPIDSKNDDEIRKRLVAELLRGSRNILWDNVMGVLNSGSMATFLTGATFGDRILGRSENVDLTNKAMLIVTGNNLQLAGELPRRFLTCRLDRQIENPLEYAFPRDAMKEIIKRRGELVRAGLIIIRGYLQSEDHKSGGVAKDKLASFNDWDTLARQPVAWLAQFNEKLADPKKVIDDAVMQDPEQEILGDLLRAIRKEYGSEWFEASQLSAVSTPEHGSGNIQLYEILSDFTGGRFNSRSIGKVLMFRRDRIVDGLKLSYFKQGKHATKFRVTEI